MCASIDPVFWETGQPGQAPFFRQVRQTTGLGADWVVTTARYVALIYRSDISYRNEEHPNPDATHLGGHAGPGVLSA